MKKPGWNISKGAIPETLALIKALPEYLNARKAIENESFKNVN